MILFLFYAFKQREPGNLMLSHTVPRVGIESTNLTLKKVLISQNNLKQDQNTQLL